MHIFANPMQVWSQNEWWGDTVIKYDQIVDVHCLDNHIRSRAASIML